MVATLMLAMFAMGCEDSSTAAEGGGGPAAATTSAERTVLSAFWGNGGVNSMEIKELRTLKLTDVKAERYEAIYRTKFIALYASETAAYDALRIADDMDAAGYAAYAAVKANLQAAVTTGNTPVLAVPSAERIVMGYLDSDLSGTPLLSANDLIKVGITDVALSTLVSNVDAYQTAYTTALINNQAGADTDAKKAAARVILTAAENEAAGTETAWNIAITALQTAVTAGNLTVTAVPIP